MAEQGKTKYTYKTPNNPVVDKKTARALKQGMVDWLGNNMDDFEALMNKAKTEDPRLYLTIYANMFKHTVPQDKNINVNVGINKDAQQLQAMARTNVSLPGEASAGALPAYTEYEEIVAEENKENIPVKPQDGKYAERTRKYLNSTDNEG